MEITYQLDEQDLLALSEHHRSISPTIRRARRLVLASCAATWLACTGFIWFATRDMAFAIALVIVGVLATPFVPAALRSSQRKATLKLYREGKNLTLFQPITLRIDHDGLTVDAASGNSTVRWEYIERVDSTDDHLFIYTCAVSAIVVPKAGVTAGDFDPFAAATQKFWRAAVAAGGVNDPMIA